MNIITKNKIIVISSLFGLHNHNLESRLCYSLFGYNAILGTFLTIDVYLFFLYQPLYPIKLNKAQIGECPQNVKPWWTQERQGLKKLLWFCRKLVKPFLFLFLFKSKRHSWFGEMKSDERREKSHLLSFWWKLVKIWKFLISGVNS